MMRVSEGVVIAKALVTLGIVVGLTGTVVIAQRPAPPPPPPPNPLSLIPTFVCSFPAHAATEWVAGSPATVLGEEKFEFQVANVNLRRGSAMIIGSGGGTAEVTAMLTATSLNVIEQTGLGNFIITTIFTAGGEGRLYRAVHSRHLGDLSGPPSVSQHFGTCAPAK